MVVNDRSVTVTLHSRKLAEQGFPINMLNADNLIPCIKFLHKFLFFIVERHFISTSIRTLESPPVYHAYYLLLPFRNQPLVITASSTAWTVSLPFPS